MGEYMSDQERSRAKWTTFSTKIFADLLIEQIRKGNRGSGGFKKLAWQNIRDEFIKQTGLGFGKKQLKNHLDFLRKRYNSVKMILDHPGFSWDADQCMVLAENDVWNDYIEAHPEADIIRERGCDIYEQLRVIFPSDSGVKEKHVTSFASGTSSHQTEEERYKFKWTLPQDKVFVNLMLEQVAQGSSRDNAFSNISWSYIQNEFNRQTGLNYDKQQLKNHQRVLKRSYLSVKSLLGQDGFNWDKSRGMVIAESDVWDNYNEKHPEIESVRGKRCPLFEQLDAIFSKSSSAGNREVLQVPKLQPTASQVDTLPSDDASKQDQSRAKWTVELDRILVNLLIEHQNNKISNKRAWKHILNKFSSRTGLNLDTEQLRNHQSVLRRTYNSIKTVLDQGNFSWNESRHMLVADDEAWEQYIMAHPGAKTVRYKECPIFRELSILFSDQRSETRHVQSSHDAKLDQLEVEMDAIPESASFSAENAADDASSRLSEEVNMSSGTNKRHCLIKPLTSSTRRRVCKETSQTGFNHVSHHEEINKTAAAASASVAAAAQSGDSFSISSCIEVLNEMVEVGVELYLAALDLFQDADHRETFICIKNDIKLAWLNGKCNNL